MSNMLSYLFPPSVARRRRKAQARATGALAEFYASEPPDPHTPVEELRCLAIDVETTGLDPNRDVVLSIGFVPVDGLSIKYSGARHILVRASTEVGQSATVHGLTDDMIAEGTPEGEALISTLSALSGRVLLAHFARIEVDFLSRLCERLFRAPLAVPVIDTLELHNRLIAPGFDDEARGNQLRLWNARTRYGLPLYGAHEALMDAVACAELYLGQVAEFSLVKPQTLKTLSS